MLHMNGSALLTVAVRLFSIYLVIYTLHYTSTMLPFVMAPPPNNVTWTYVAVFASSFLLAALLLFKFPGLISRKLLGGSHETTNHEGREDIEIIAFTVLGLWVLSRAIPDIFYWVTFSYKIYAVRTSPALAPDQIGNIVGTVVELAIGGWLVFGANGLKGILRSLRTAGRRS